ncbi:hypothetical protein ACJMK2_014331 [Sinanodonta woodiana]|uniref:Hexosyltransferase n=1 Tax=Sinanodonta woodiana TaxID=1069815 RepID=A0ABD3V0S5_SINWO
MRRLTKTYQKVLFVLITVTTVLSIFYYYYTIPENESQPNAYFNIGFVLRLYSNVATILNTAFKLVSKHGNIFDKSTGSNINYNTALGNIISTSTKSSVSYRKHQNIFEVYMNFSANYRIHGNTMVMSTQTSVNYSNHGNIIETSTQSNVIYGNNGNITATSTHSSTSYSGIEHTITMHNGHDDMIIPGKDAWIPYPVKRNPSGPFIIKMNDGSAIQYTNYTFYPLTFNCKYIINNPNICKDVTNFTFLIIVHTAVPHFYQRQALRETWANPRLLKSHSSRILFLVGRIENETVQRSLETESKQFQDIVQGDFIDDYHNLTHKGVLGYRWITEYCQNAKFILKIDDDVFVNIFRVIHTLLPNFTDGQRKIACRLHKYSYMHRSGKFAVDPDYFPLLNNFPLMYCPGPFVLMPRRIVPEMFEVARTVPFIWIDDLYLFGILPNEIRNVVFLPLEDVHNREETALKCYLGDKPCNYLASYAWTPGVMYVYWNSTLNMHKDLVNKYSI